MLVTGLAPILAPLVGGADARDHVVARASSSSLAVLSALIALLVALGLRETLPPERRSRQRPARARCRPCATLLRDRWFVGHALAGGLAFGALFAYISGSSFVLQGIYGALAAALQRAVRDERARADRGQPGQRAARRPLRAGAAAAPRRSPRSPRRPRRCSSWSPSAAWASGPCSSPMFVDRVEPVLRAARTRRRSRSPTTRRWRGRRPRCSASSSSWSARSSAPLVGAAGTDSAVPMAAVMIVLALGGAGRRAAAPAHACWRRAR